MNWYAPEIEVTIGNRTQRAGVNKLEVTAARGQPVATASLELSNVRFEWNGGAKNGDPLVIKWGRRGQALEALFDGTVKQAELRETFRVLGLCRCRALADARITRTYQEETVDAVVRHLVGGLGFASLDLDPCDLVLDRLPLHGDSVVNALDLLGRRYSLDRAFWADPNGGFHWKEANEGQAAAARFTHGDDVQDWQPLPGNGRLLTVAGANIWHSQVIEVAERDGTVRRYFVEQVRHSLAGPGGGLRTSLWLKEVLQ
jgi:hypothetical protein